MFGLILTYYSVVLAAGVNMPFLDDYNFLYDILRIEDHGSLHRKIFSIIAQHNEHRIAFSRMVGLSQLHLTGYIDFAILAFIGNLGLLATAFFVAWGGKNRGAIFWQSFLILVPVLFIAYQGYQMFWAMPSISNYWSVAWSLGSLACLAWSHKTSLVWACLLALLAVFTSGQGLILLPVALLALIYFRRWNASIVWGMLCFLVWISYFKLHYIKVENPENKELWKMVAWFLILVGQAPAEVLLMVIPDSLLGSPNNYVAVRGSCGILICLLAGFLVLQNRFRSHFFQVSATAYVFSLCAAAARSRSFLPYYYAMSTQYHNWSLLIIGLLALGTLGLFATSPYRFRIFAGLFSLFFVVNLAFWVSEYSFLKGFQDYRQRSKMAFLKTGDLFKNNPTDRDSVILARLKAENKPTNMMEDTFLPEEERIYQERILWRAYLYGAMPLSEMRFDEEIYFDRGKLQHIIGEFVQSSLISRNDSTPLLLLREENGRYRLIDLTDSEVSRAGDGMIFVRDKTSMKKTGGWEVLKKPELFLKNQAFSSGERLFAVLPESQKE